MTLIDPPLTFVSNSEAKLNEYRILLGMPSLLRFPMPEAESTTTQLDMLVREKCEKASKHVDPPLFVEHTALAIDALDGFPGVTTQPFLSKISNAKLLTMIENEKGDGRRATARIAIGYLQTTGAKVKVIEAQTSGYISDERRGTSGFGWDEIFVPEGELKTYAEMTIEEKNRTSMRAKIADSFGTLLRDFKGTDGVQLQKPVLPESASYPPDRPPESLLQALLALAWSSKPWLRNLVLGIGLFCVVAFGLWASFPDSMKQHIIDWIVAHSR
jgi:XTP/dITP diphosphohydrolase